MCQIAVNRARERGYQSVADFEHPKVDFDFHPKVQNEDLPVGGQLFHVGAGSSDEHTLILDKEVLFQFFRDIPGVCPKQSSQLLVHLAENLSVAAIARRQKDFPQDEQEAARIVWGRRRVYLERIGTGLLYRE